MDIVARLKEFINYSKIPVTQFADNARIPRPSLSQLLNGRNRKVSDEVITKIHSAYPQLNMMWFIFGEGEMIQVKADSNTTPLQPQNEAETAKEQYVSPSVGMSEESQSSADSLNTINFSGDFMASHDLAQNDGQSASDYENESSISLSDLTPTPNKVIDNESDRYMDSQNQTPSPQKSSEISHSESLEGNVVSRSNNDDSHSTEKSARSSMSNPINFSTSPNKTIVNIIIYYSDNSYESFTPESQS